MKKLLGIICSSIITATCAISAQAQFQTSTPDQQRLQMAKEGCQKPIGFFPTPSKLMCILTATGTSEKEVKPKALALVFNVCQGHLTQTSAGVTPKAYSSLGACLSDPTAVALINKELTTHKFPEIKIVNSSVFTAPAAPATAPATAPAAPAAPAKY